MDTAKGKVEHKRIIKNGIQRDIFTTRIPLDSVDDKGLSLLGYWCVEDFDKAWVDFKNDEFVLEYETIHYLPRGVIPDYDYDCEDD